METTEGLATHLKGKTALVTGAGSGIGQATALLLAQQGAQVGLLGRSKDKLEETQSKLGPLAKTTTILQADITNTNALREAVDRLVAATGRLDMLFANAGVNGVWAPIDDLEPEEFRKTIDINLFGTFLTIQAAARAMKQGDGGSIVVTSSINGNRKFTSAGSSAYSASKAAQVALTKVLALELAQSKIRINAICPGEIETSIEDHTERRNIDKAIPKVEFPDGYIPLTGGKSGSAQDVAKLVVFLLSSASSHITGAEVVIDGGQSLIEG